MDLWLLKAGHKIKTRDGAEAEVLAETEDGEWIRVKYLQVEDNPLLVGTEDLAHGDQVEALLGVARKSTWGDSVAVILHHVPETEVYEGGYEAVTMMGIPHGVIITGGSPDTGEAALNHLLAGLQAFGFSGSVSVEDATYIDGVQQYEVEI